MYCPKCQTQLDANAKSCTNCGYSADGTTSQPVLVTAARPARIPVELNLVVSVDRSGSSSQFKDGIRIIFEKTIKALQEKMSALKISLWTHSDLDYDEQPVQLTDQGTPNEAIAEASAIEHVGGGDLPESHADQLENLLQVSPWGADPATSRNALLMFATDETKPLRSGKTMKDLGREILDQGIKLFMVCQDTPNIHQIVSAAQGFLIQISNEPDDAEIDQIVSMLTSTITATMAADSTLPMTEQD